MLGLRKDDTAGNGTVFPFVSDLGADTAIDVPTKAAWVLADGVVRVYMLAAEIEAYKLVRVGGI